MRIGQVLIVGQARPWADPAIEHLAENPDREVWVINGPAFPPVWDRLFQLHGLDHLRERHGDAFVEFLATIRPPRTLYMTEHHADVPRAKLYPVNIARSVLGDYFTGSFPYAIALAVLERFAEIRLDGIDFREKETWAVPCIEHAIGFARGRGVSVIVPPDRGLFSPGPWGPRYGFEGVGSR